MGNLAYLIPVVVLLFEYTAVSAALAYAKFAVDFEQPTVSLLSGLVRIGGNLPYDAVPNAVFTLHLLALLLSVIFIVYFMFFISPGKRQEPAPPQEG